MFDFIKRLLGDKPAPIQPARPVFTYHQDVCHTRMVTFIHREAGRILVCPKCKRYKRTGGNV